MRVVLCGNRRYATGPAIDRALAPYLKPNFINRTPFVIISCGSSEIDRRAEEWAAAHDVPVEHFRSNPKYGAWGDNIRNDDIVAAWVDDVLCFGRSWYIDLCQRARRADIRVREIYPPAIARRRMGLG